MLRLLLGIVLNVLSYLTILEAALLLMVHASLGCVWSGGRLAHPAGLGVALQGIQQELGAHGPRSTVTRPELLSAWIENGAPASAVTPRTRGVPPAPEVDASTR